MGVLTYLLSLPEGARANIRSPSDQRKDGRARIAAALLELEEFRYLRRVVRKSGENGQLFTTYEVFDTPYDEEPPDAPESESPEAEPEAVLEPQNLAFGESAGAAAGEPPSGAKNQAARAVAVATGEDAEVAE
ncbi:hypothetical protein ABZ896_34730 [Streptomyces sp. NPDC047072]|uniref:hypothetical protein n=1 Tax=Streptomyces sp. NPDC047072 TaxID=3154809 RepID=UPI0033EC7D9B